jgi:hypothetical protein
VHIFNFLSQVNRKLNQQLNNFKSRWDVVNKHNTATISNVTYLFPQPAATTQRNVSNALYNPPNPLAGKRCLSNKGQRKSQVSGECTYISPEYHWPPSLSLGIIQRHTCLGLQGAFLQLGEAHEMAEGPPASGLRLLRINVTGQSDAREPEDGADRTTTCQRTGFSSISNGSDGTVENSR